MRSNYKKLGDYIQQVNNRNTDLISDDLRGLSMSKEFRKSTSNIVGTDLSKYKLVYKNQFACDYMSVIRVHKFPVVRHIEDQPVIVSPAYTVFEVIDENVLNPEYLMMWFSRPELDRYADFRCDSSVRGGFKWDEMCEVELPIPSIEKQQDIVKEYNTVVNRIKLNEQLNQKLEETAQALYKHWFVDFEFPNEDGKPYKSSGGAMEYNEELDKEIPEGWRIEALGDVIESFSKKHPFDKEELIFFNTSDILEGEFLHADYMSIYDMPGQAKKQIRKGDILFSEIRPKNKRYALVRIDTQDYVVSTKLMVLRLRTQEFSPYRLYHFLTDKDFINELQFSAEGRSGTFPQITFEEDIEYKPFLIANEMVETKWEDILRNYYNQSYSRIDENKLLLKIRDLLLSKMTRVEVEEEIVKK